MHLRDTRILAWVKERAAQNGGAVRLTHEEIANEFQCHHNTASAIIRRLEAVGLLAVDRKVKCGGFIYRAGRGAVA